MNIQSKSNKYHLWFYFCQTYDLLYGCKQEFLSKSNITSEQFHVLWSVKYLNETNGAPVILSKLAKQLMRNINSVSELVNRMEKGGLIEKIRDLPDKRAVRIELTKKGEKIFSENARPNLDFVDRVFSTFNERDMKSFLRLMKKMNKWIRKDFDTNRTATDPLLNDPANIDRFLNKIY